MAAWAGKGVGYVDTTLGIGCCWRSRQGATDAVGLVGEGLGMRVVVYATPGGAAVGAGRVPLRKWALGGMSE